MGMIRKTKLGHATVEDKSRLAMRLIVQLNSHIYGLANDIKKLNNRVKDIEKQNEIHCL